MSDLIVYVLDSDGSISVSIFRDNEMKRGYCVTCTVAFHNNNTTILEYIRTIVNSENKLIPKKKERGYDFRIASKKHIIELLTQIKLVVKEERRKLCIEICRIHLEKQSQKRLEIALNKWFELIKIKRPNYIPYYFTGISKTKNIQAISVNKIYNRSNILNCYEKGYIAGVLDGDGCIYLNKKKKAITVIFTNKSKPLLEKISYLIGINTTICYQQSKDVYNIQYKHSAIKHFLPQLKLIVRERKRVLALEILKYKTGIYNQYKSNNEIWKIDLLIKMWQ